MILLTQTEVETFSEVLGIEAKFEAVTNQLLAEITDRGLRHQRALQRALRHAMVNFSSGVPDGKSLSSYVL